MNNSVSVVNDLHTSTLNEITYKYLDFRGKTPLKIGMDWGGGDILALSAKNVVMGGINKNKEAYYGSEALYSKWMNKGNCERGDILLTMEAPLGKVAQIPDDKKYILSQRVILIKLRKEIVYPEYIFHLFMGDEFQRNLIKHSTGSTVTGIQQKKLDKISISYPSLKNQEKISKILTTIDQLIEKTQVLIDKHDSIKQGMMSDLFTRGIDLSTGQLRTSVEQAPHLYKETVLGWIPKEWDIERLDSAVTFLDGQRIPLKQEERAEMKGDIPYYGASGIIDYVNNYIFDDDLILLGEDGENVVSRSVPLSFQIHGKSWINNHAHVLKPLSENNIDYLTEYLEFLDYSSIVSGSAQPKITQGLLAKMKIKLPTEDEQLQIGIRINTIKKRIKKEEVHIQKLKSEKDGLMQDLLTGKVTVS